MATKINTNYYGAESAFVNESGTYISGNVKKSPYTVWDLVDNGDYTGGAFDYTAAPWGIGESSISSDFSGKIMKTADNKIVTEYHFNKKGNSPLFLYRNNYAASSMDYQSGDVQYDTIIRDMVTCRVDPETDIQNSTTIMSTLSIDTDYNCLSSGALSTTPITYLNYNKIRILPRYTWVLLNGRKDPVKYYTEWLLTNPDNSLDDGQIYQIVGFDIECFFQNGSVGSMVTNGDYTTYFAPSVQSNPLDIPDILKRSYYGDDNNKYVRTHRAIKSVGTWSITNRYGGNYTAIPYANLSGIASASDFDDQRDDPPLLNAYSGQLLQPFGNLSTKHQVFDDVSYHWEIVIGRAYTYSLPQNFDVLEDGDAIPETGVFYPYAKLVIDDSIYETEREAYYYAIIHECAFMGFPVVGSQKCIACNIGDTTLNGDVYLPVFDEHWVTTGDFKTGAASLNLVNSLWGDVFSLIMPEYDPTYNPNPEPDGDSGDLDNASLSGQYFRGSNRYYLVNESTLKDFIGAVNGMYVSSPDDTQLKLDFKGSNPNDYIVGIYGIPIDLVASTIGETIHLGPVDTTIPAAVLSPTWQHTINFGEYDIPAYFGDFRDFEPYTSIELYIPLCGTVQLDPREYVGHTVKVDGIFDLQTGELTCRVIRKSSLGDTVTHTLNGSIWVSLPVSARDMGDFQNNQHQIKMALIQTGVNQISRTFGRASTDINSVASAVKTGGKSGLNLNGLNAVTVAGDAIQTGIDTANLTYQLTHTPAPISTTSTASTSNGVMMYNRAKIFIKRCAMLSTYNAETYAHTIGHACIINTTIGDEVTESGNSLIVCSNADLSGISATAAEISAIQSLLTGGIYV